MLSRRDRVAAGDMLSAARRAIEYAPGVSPEQFSSDRMRADAKMAALMIVGEACKRVSPDGRRELPDVRWRDLSDIRQFVMHKYFLVDPAELHQAVSESLPDLVAELAPHFAKQARPTSSECLLRSTAVANLQDREPESQCQR